MVRRALLIGVNTYRPGLPSLSTPEINVEELKQVLENSKTGGYEVRLLHSPTAQEMRTEIEQLFRTCSKNDLALLFFSGHGVKNEQGELFFTACDTLHSNNVLREATAVSAYDVRKWMNDSRCRHQVIILDCCFSGAFSANVAAMGDGKIDISAQLDAQNSTRITATASSNNLERNPLGREGRAVLTSSDSTEYSFEPRGSHEQRNSDLSIYTRYLVEGLRTGVADSDEDGYISAYGLHEYTKNRVKEESPAMTPKFFAYQEGHGILLARSQPEPESRYRRVVTKYSEEGEIPDNVRSTLNALCDALKLTPEQAKKIEEEVLRPGRELQRKKQVYRKEFTKLLVREQQFPFSRGISDVLKELQNSLELEKKDIEKIQKPEVLNLCETELDEVVKQSKERTTATV